MHYMITGERGKVIKMFNDCLSKYGLIRSKKTSFCMTPFQLMEVLGIQLKEVRVIPRHNKGEIAREVIGRVVDETLEQYIQLPELSQYSLEARARDRRKYVQFESLDLYDMCVLHPTLQVDVGSHIASSLAWDNALKATYPKSIATEVDQFLCALLLTKGHDNISRFRVAKRMWSKLYGRSLKMFPDSSAEINQANKAMRLKTRKDFLDCDLIHLACFGWFGEDVLVATCDPPETVLWRLAVYKGMVAAVPTTISQSGLPKVRHGIIVTCNPDGAITHIFQAQTVPTIV